MFRKTTPSTLLGFMIQVVASPPDAFGPMPTKSPQPAASPPDSLNGIGVGTDFERKMTRIPPGEFGSGIYDPHTSIVLGRGTVKGKPPTAAPRAKSKSPGATDLPGLSIAAMNMGAFGQVNVPLSA